MFTKPTDKITFEDVKNFCQEFGEGVRVEYKRKVVHIPKIVSSFANTFGGIFVIGAETDEMNKVEFPILGIPKQNGIEEQILQSTLMGIYPAVIPEVVIVDVPNSNNMVVVVRVDESIQAPHAIQNSTKVYIRTGSITQPYKLADMDRIAYMFKRREDAQIVAKQIINRIEERTDVLCATDNPNLTVIIKPIFPYRPIISTTEIYSFASERLNPNVEASNLRRVPDGTRFLIGIEKPYDCLELNVYGVLYYRNVYLYHLLNNIGSENADSKSINFASIVRILGQYIQKAEYLYARCGYLGNLEVKAKLRQVLGEKLLFSENQPGYLSEIQECVDSEIIVTTQCLTWDIAEREKFINVIDSLTQQILWAFNVSDFDKTRKLVEKILTRNNLLPQN